MRSRIILTLFIIMLVGLTVHCGWCSKKEVSKEYMLLETTQKIDDIKKLFALTPEEIAQKTDRYIAKAKQEIEQMIAIPDDKRTFENTADVLDRIDTYGNLGIFGNVISFIEYLHPNESLRNAAHEAIKKIQSFSIETISTNKKVYEAFKAYADGNAHSEKLSDEQRYFVQETMKGFKRAGLHLPEQELGVIREIKKELSDLSLTFDRNIAIDNPTMRATKEELEGLGENVLANLKKENDEYILGVDYPTVFSLLRDCRVGKTRERMYRMFQNRGYPANESVFTSIIQKRDDLARALGFDSYAALDLDSQMVKTPERAREFLQGLLDRALPKEKEEIIRWLSEMPEGVSLDKEGKVLPWDLAYITNEYKKKHFDLDEEKLAEYFPMDHALNQLLDIYRQFFSIDFDREKIDGLWSDDLEVITVYNKDRSQLLGRLILDLFPRDNKFSHAAVGGIIPRITHSSTPGFAIMMANFPKPTPGKPALWKRDDVNTFFHEFGHALHHFFGRTQLGSFAGTSTKTDFVELPSQILEEWLTDPAILKKVSNHYKAGEPLSDEVITKIIALKNFNSGWWTKRQVFLSLIALDYFAPGASKDPYAVWLALEEIMNDRVAIIPDIHKYASFGHLTGYGAKYYGYLWSKVFALDIFDTIKKHGLLDPVIGQKYVDAVISKGGSKDPDELLIAFLGRGPKQDAFFKAMGF